MQRTRALRILPFVGLTVAVLAGCEQPIAARVSPTPAEDADISRAASVAHANPADVQHARAMLDRLVSAYNTPGSPVRADVQRRMEKTARLAAKRGQGGTR